MESVTTAERKKNRNFEFQLKGYNSETSDTDDLVVWVSAPSREAVERFAALQGWELDGTGIDPLPDEYTGADGIDYRLNEDGTIGETYHKVPPMRIGKLDRERTRPKPEGPEVVIFVRDGNVQGVRASIPLTVTMVDYDNIEAGDPHPFLNDHLLEEETGSYHGVY